MDGLAIADATSDELLALGRFLTALGDPTRQRIMLLLSRERLNVSALADRFHLSRPAVSHQIKVLLDAGLLVFGALTGLFVAAASAARHGAVPVDA